MEICCYCLSVQPHERLGNMLLLALTSTSEVSLSPLALKAGSTRSLSPPLYRWRGQKRDGPARAVQRAEWSWGRIQVSDFLGKESPPSQGQKDLGVPQFSLGDWKEGAVGIQSQASPWVTGMGGPTPFHPLYPSVWTSFPDLCPLRRGQKAPGAVRTVQGVELRGRGCQLHVKAETPKYVEGVGGLVVHRRMTIETWQGWGTE